MSTNEAPIKNHKLYNKSEIAKKIKISQSYVSRVMRGKTRNAAVLQKILALINSKAEAA